MRSALAFLAVLALLVSPVTAAAAQAACGHDASGTSAVMDMPAKAGAAQAVASAAAGDPCCDHNSDQHKMSDKSCAQACANSCVVTAALPSSVVELSPVSARAPVTPARAAAVLSYRPPGPERPPKSMA